MTGTSAFIPLIEVSPKASPASLALRSSPLLAADSLAFSLRNLGAISGTEALSTIRVFSTWFLRVLLGFGAQPPKSVGFIEVRTSGSIFAGGLPTSKTRWLGQA